MIRVSRKVTINRKHNTSVYEERNAKAFGVGALYLTSSVGAVNSMLSSASELAVLMPSVIGLSPNNEEWQSRVTDYFHSIRIPVSKIGTTLNISYTFNVNLDRAGFKDKLNAYIEEKGIVLESLNEKDPTKTDQVALEKEVCDYISGKKGTSFAMSETELYNFVVFENVEDYIKYRYCLVSSRVANDVSLINKSNRIDFYISTEESTVKEQEVRYKQNQEALKTYMNIVSGNTSDMDDYLISFGLISSHADIIDYTISQKGSLLQTLAINDPVRFMELYKRPNHKHRAFIEKLIWFNVLNRVASTGTIVDSSDASKIVGNSIDEAVTFISNKVNAGIVALWENKLQSILK